MKNYSRSRGGEGKVRFRTPSRFLPRPVQIIKKLGPAPTRGSQKAIR